jgi:hypothetical protein
MQRTGLFAQQNVCRENSANAATSIFCHLTVVACDRQTALNAIQLFIEGPVVGAVVAQTVRWMGSIKANVPLSAGDDDAH